MEKAHGSCALLLTDVCCQDPSATPTIIRRLCYTTESCASMLEAVLDRVTDLGLLGLGIGRMYTVR